MYLNTEQLKQGNAKVVATLRQIIPEKYGVEVRLDDKYLANPPKYKLYLHIIERGAVYNLTAGDKHIEIGYLGNSVGGSSIPLSMLASAQQQLDTLQQEVYTIYGD